MPGQPRPTDLILLHNGNSPPLADFVISAPFATALTGWLARAGCRRAESPDRVIGVRQAFSLLLIVLAAVVAKLWRGYGKIFVQIGR